MRVHGTGEPIYRDDPRFTELLTHFGDADGPGLRAIIVVTARRISDTCGYAVPFMDYVEDRDPHARHFGRKTDEEFAAYCENKEYNPVSIDGLPALPLPLPLRQQA